MIKPVTPAQPINKELPRRTLSGGSKPKQTDVGFAEALKAALTKGSS